MMRRVKLSELVSGMTLVDDGGFACLEPSTKHTVLLDTDLNQFYIKCNEGKHFLDGQKDRHGYLIGLFEDVDGPSTTKKNFKNMDRVRIHSTNSDALDGRIGSIVGIAYQTIHDNFYIINVDGYPIPTWPWSCVILTEHCIEPLKK